MKISPMQIYGNWDVGYTIDYHTIRSIPIGVNEFGYPIFDTTYTELGGLLHDYKYYNKHDNLLMIKSSIINFLTMKEFAKDAEFIIPAPPTKRRDYQPVYEIAKAVAESLGIPYKDVLYKKPGSQAKNMSNQSCDRIFVKGSILECSRILIIDDIYGTGATLNECVSVLKRQWIIEKIYVLALTRKKAK